MIKKILTIALVVLSTLTFAQGGTTASRKMEDAKKAFINNDYKTALAKLNEFEKTFGGITAKSLYLRISIQEKMFDPQKLYVDDTQFNLLLALRTNISFFEQTFKDTEDDDLFFEQTSVYATKLTLQSYPKDRIEWLKEKQRYESDKKGKRN